MVELVVLLGRLLVAATTPFGRLRIGLWELRIDLWGCELALVVRQPGSRLQRHDDEHALHSSIPPTNTHGQQCHIVRRSVADRADGQQPQPQPQPQRQQRQQRPQRPPANPRPRSPSPSFYGATWAKKQMATPLLSLWEQRSWREVGLLWEQMKATRASRSQLLHLLTLLLAPIPPLLCCDSVCGSAASPRSPPFACSLLPLLLSWLSRCLTSRHSPSRPEWGPWKSRSGRVTPTGRQQRRPPQPMGHRGQETHISTAEPLSRLVASG